MKLKNNVSNFSVQAISIMSRRGQRLCVDPVLRSLVASLSQVSLETSFSASKRSLKMVIRRIVKIKVLH